MQHRLYFGLPYFIQKRTSLFLTMSFFIFAFILPSVALFKVYLALKYSGNVFRTVYVQMNQY